MHQTSTSRSSDPASELVDQLTRAGSSLSATVGSVVAAQCRLGGARCGVLLRLGPGSSVDVLAVEPALTPGSQAPLWLAQSAELAPRAIDGGRTVVAGLAMSGDPDAGHDDEHLVVIPVRGMAGFQGVSAFVVQSMQPQELGPARERLEVSMALLGLLELRQDIVQREEAVHRLRSALEVLAAVDRHSRFRAGAMALVNELAARWSAERVALGMVRGRAVNVETISNVDKVVRSMQLVQDLGSAMEECADQDLELVYIPATSADADAVATPDAIVREAAELSQRHGPTAVCLLPLRRGDEVVGVVSVERAASTPLTNGDVETLRLALDLCSVRLADRFEQDRWAGARLAAWGRRGLATIVGPRHTWAKLAAVLSLAVLVVVSVVEAPDRVRAPFEVRADGRRVVPAPFEGYISEVLVRPGDAVVAGETVMASLETAELRLSLAAEEAAMASKEREADAARSADRIAEAQIAEAAAREAGARVGLLRHRLAQARITAPISGVVIAGDLDGLSGAPVRAGETLFEIAPEGSLSARLAIDERRIVDLAVGQRGQLAPASFPQRRIGFTVDRIAAGAVPEGGRNVFAVDVMLDERPEWLRPGMEGEARVEVGRGSYLRLWTRELSDWLRLKLWW